MHFEMANLSKRKFKKLPANITISAKGNARHGPWIKIQNNYGEDIQPEHMFAMTVPDGKIIGDAGDLSAADLKYFEKFVSTNMKILFEYWNNGQNMDILDVIESLIFWRLEIRSYSQYLTGKKIQQHLFLKQKKAEILMKIEHVAMWVKDLEKAKNFFTEYFEGSAGELYHK